MARSLTVPIQISKPVKVSYKSRIRLVWPSKPTPYKGGIGSHIQGLLTIAFLGQNWPHTDLKRAEKTADTLFTGQMSINYR